MTETTSPIVITGASDGIGAVRPCCSSRLTSSVVVGWASPPEGPFKMLNEWAELHLPEVSTVIPSR
jgi:hypothetical protein